MELSATALPGPPAGFPVGSSRTGYFCAITAGEVYSTIRQLRQMAAGLEAAIQGLEGALEDFHPQGGGNGRQV